MPDSETLTLPARPSALQPARAWAAGLAREAGFGPTAVGVVQLLTSELVANAVRHTTSEVVEVQVVLDGGAHAITVSVCDTSPATPVMRTTGPEVPGGHGMRIVDRLATSWGVRPTDGGGKTVWFSLEDHGG